MRCVVRRYRHLPRRVRRRRDTRLRPKPAPVRRTRFVKGVDFTWNDASGAAVHDPSVLFGGPGTLAMRRDLVPRLTDAGLTIFWTVLIGNELYRSDHMPPGDDYRWVSASASYILNVDRVEQVGAIAVRCRPGPTTERELEWMTRRAEG